MSTLPAANYISNAGRTEGEEKQAFEDFLAAVKQIPGAGVAFSTLTLSTDAVTPASGQGHFLIDTQGGAASDDCKNIVYTNLPDGSAILFRTVSSARVVTLKHAAGGNGQLSLADGADLALADPSMWVLFCRNGTLWEEVVRSWGTQKASFRTRYGMASLPVARGADLTAAATLTLGTDGDLFHVTGNTTITAISNGVVGQIIGLIFEGTPQLTHSASLILAGAQNYACVAGTTKFFAYEAVGVWREMAAGGGGGSGAFTEYASPGTYTWTRGNANVVEITMAGGGGGGGGAAYAGGGGGGAVLKKIRRAVSGDLTVVVGASGSGAAGGAGGNGGTTTVTGTGVSLSCGGGTGGSSTGGGGGGLQPGSGGGNNGSGNPGEAGTEGASGAGGGGPCNLDNQTHNGGRVQPWSGGAGSAYSGGGGGGGASGLAPGADGVQGGTGGAGSKGSGGGGSWSGTGGAGGAGYVLIEVVG